MKKLVVLLLVVGFAASAFSVSVVQNPFRSVAQRTVGGVTSNDWFAVSNWSGNVNVGTPGLPQNDTATLCNGATMYGALVSSYDSIGAIGSAIIDGGNAEVGQLRVGSSNTTSTGTPAALTINSGSLTVGNSYSPLHSSGFLSIGSDSAAGGSTGRNGLFYVNGGSVSVLHGQGNIVIGNGNSNGLANCYGKMYMSGGTVDALNIIIGRYTGVTGELYLSGGTITANTLSMNPSMNGTALFDITGNGKLILDGDKTSLIATYISNGWLTGNGNDYDILFDYDATNPGKTTVFVPEPATMCLLGLGIFGFIRRK